MATAATVRKPSPPPGPREALVEAHAELQRLRAQATTLERERQEAAQVVDRRKAERATAHAHVDLVKSQAIADKASERPAGLIEAENVLNRATSEFDFAEAILSKADASLRETQAAIERAAQDVRATARSMLSAKAGEMAERLLKIESEAASLRVAFRGLVACTQGLGVNLPLNAVTAYREPPGFAGTEPTINSPEYRRERELASEWREWIELAVRDPQAEMPT
jgi:hypothetical protein